jgi:hypothetical protein
LIGFSCLLRSHLLRAPDDKVHAKSATSAGTG